MFSWLSRKVSFAGSVLFRGTFPLRREEFDFLREHQVEIEPVENNPENVIWALQLKHPEWGTGTLLCFRNAPLPPTSFIDYDATLTGDERGEIRSAGTALVFGAQNDKCSILQARKGALALMRLIMGNEGVAAVDHVSQRFWSRDALDMELSHGADLDIDSLMTLHAVYAEDRAKAHWLHSHGLGEMGFFDFDILLPSPDLLGVGYDHIRSIAFGILEGNLTPNASHCHAFPIRTVSAADFMRKAPPELRRLRDDPDQQHMEKRAILCEPIHGLISRLRGSIEISRFFSAPEIDPRVGIHFSDEACEMMARRARETYRTFRSIADELNGLNVGLAVKLGCQTDRGKREHLWFEVNNLSDNEIDATLANEPFHISGMHQGQRGKYPLDLLTDWQIFTPAGAINPRQSKVLRHIRAHREELQAAWNVLRQV